MTVRLCFRCFQGFVQARLLLLLDHVNLANEGFCHLIDVGSVMLFFCLNKPKLYVWTKAGGLTQTVDQITFGHYFADQLWLWMVVVCMCHLNSPSQHIPPSLETGDLYTGHLNVVYISTEKAYCNAYHVYIQYKYIYICIYIPEHGILKKVRWEKFRHQIKRGGWKPKKKYRKRECVTKRIHICKIIGALVLLRVLGWDRVQISGTGKELWHVWNGKIGCNTTPLRKLARITCLNSVELNALSCVDTASQLNRILASTNS